MTAARELTELLTHVTHRIQVDAVDGLETFTELLAEDSNGSSLAFLERELPSLSDSIRGGIASVLAKHYYEQGDLANI